MNNFKFNQRLKSAPFREDLGGFYDKKLFQDRFQKSSQEQSIFFYKHFWIGDWSYMFYADCCFCLQ